MRCGQRCGSALDPNPGGSVDKDPDLEVCSRKAEKTRKNFAYRAGCLSVEFGVALGVLNTV
jgi:hypothetical protein